MRATITELMHANLLEVFNERDSAHRRATIEHVYADDIRWTADDGVTTGRAALDAKAAELQAKLGNLQFIAAGPVHQTLGLRYLAFQLVKPGSSAPEGSGFDVAIVRDGFIVELYTVLTDHGGEPAGVCTAPPAPHWIDHRNQRGGIVTEVNEFNRRNIEEFRSNHGRLGGPFEGAPVLLLHTTGARSGQERVHPLMYLADGGRYLLFASAAGVDRSPAWYWNLIANPDASVEVGDEHLHVHAVELSGAQRDAKYAEQAQRYPQYAEYQRMTARNIPVVALIPNPTTS